MPLSDAPAYEEYVSETDNKPIYTNTGKFYKKTETGYELVESGNLDADNTYYQPQTASTKPYHTYAHTLTPP